MKNRYLVANPFGSPLVRCDTIEEVKAFVKWHCEKCSDSYRLLTGNVLKESNYQVRDLTEIDTYKEFNKKRLI